MTPELATHTSKQVNRSRQGRPLLIAPPRTDPYVHSLAHTALISDIGARQSCIAKVHQSYSRIAIPAPNHVNLPSGSSLKRLTFALRWPTLRPWPQIGIYPRNPLILLVVAQIWLNSALVSATGADRPLLPRRFWVALSPPPCGSACRRAFGRSASNTSNT
jgi:hypothetical protein